MGRDGTSREMQAQVLEKFIWRSADIRAENSRKFCSIEADLYLVPASPIPICVTLPEVGTLLSNASFMAETCQTLPTEQITHRSRIPKHLWNCESWIPVRDPIERSHFIQVLAVRWFSQVVTREVPRHKTWPFRQRYFKSIGTYFHLLGKYPPLQPGLGVFAYSDQFMRSLLLVGPLVPIEVP